MEGEANFLVILVGLPASGKSFLAQKLAGFLERVGIVARVFNLGEYRRRLSDLTEFDAKFFDKSNQTGTKTREECAHLGLADALDFLGKGSPKVALYDGTNTTMERRQWLRSDLAQQPHQVVWAEVVLVDEQLRIENVKKSKVGGADYQNFKDPQAALCDFMLRVDEYKKAYVPFAVTEVENLPSHGYLRVTNMGAKVEILKSPVLKSPVISLIHAYVESIYTGKVAISFGGSEPPSDDTPSASNLQTLLNHLANPKVTFIKITRSDV
jgi:adenylate kinase family enzyme